MTADELRPPLLTIGVVLTAIRAAVGLIGAGCGLLLVSGATFVAVPLLIAEREPEGLLPVAGAGLLFGLLVGFALLVHLIRLVACWGAWNMQRGWMIVLLIATVIGLFLDLLTAGGLRLCCCCLPLWLAADLIVFAGIVQGLALVPRD